MERVAFQLKVREDKIEEYKEHHRAVWPEMLDALRRNGWHNYSLFMREDGLLFGYFETPVLSSFTLSRNATRSIGRLLCNFTCTGKR